LDSEVGELGAELAGEWFWGDAIENFQHQPAVDCNLRCWLNHFKARTLEMDTVPRPHFKHHFVLLISFLSLTWKGPIIDEVRKVGVEIHMAHGHVCYLLYRI